MKLHQYTTFRQWRDETGLSYGEYELAMQGLLEDHLTIATTNEVQLELFPDTLDCVTTRMVHTANKHRASSIIDGWPKWKQ